MKNLKLKLSFALIITATAAYVAFLEVQASDDSDEQINSAAVWSPSDKDLAVVNQACEQDQAQSFFDCFIAHMPDLGASEQAVSFTREYAAQHRETVAILKDFHAMDSVDLGYVYFPGAREQAQGWLLLNGYPSVVDVDDLERLPKAVMEKNPLWAELLSKYPALGIFADSAERSPDKIPEMKQLPDDSQRFIIQYALRNGCTSCQLAGHAAFSFEFDPSGQLVTVRFVSITPALASESPSPEK